MHWHCSLWVPPPPSTISREFPPCSCSLSKVGYALYSKYPSLLLNPINWHLSPLKLHARNPFLLWCSPNPCSTSPCYWYFVWLPRILPIPNYFHYSYPATLLWTSTSSPKLLENFDRSILFLYSLLVLDLQIKKSKQSICHLYIVFYYLLKHSSNFYMFIQLCFYPLHKP